LAIVTGQQLMKIKMDFKSGQNLTGVKYKMKKTIILIFVIRKPSGKEERTYTKVLL